jgi:hypothetical protein
MNLIIVISVILIIIIVIISIIAFIIYNKNYKTYNTDLSINVKVVNPEQEATFTKTINLNNSDTQNVYNTILSIGNVKGEISLDNKESRSIKINIECKDNLDSYITVNTLVDKLAKLNIPDMNYSGNLFVDVIKKEYEGKYTENNGKIIINNLSMNILYTREFKDYDVVDLKAENEEYLKQQNQQQGQNQDQQQTQQNPNQDQQNQQKQENFKDIDVRIKQEHKNGDFVLYENQPNMFLHITLFNITTPELIEQTQKIIEYPIFTYSAFKDIKEQTDIILEPYKGAIARKTSDNGLLNYELHYHSTKTIDTDYKKIYEKINNAFGTLMLKFNDNIYIYQSSDIIKIKRYIKQLEEFGINVTTDDNDKHIKIAQINKLPSQLFN